MSPPSSSNMLYVEIKNHGGGEDAPPLGLEAPAGDQWVIGVFDGLGGAGGQKATGPNGELRTGAYRASRVASRSTEQFFVEEWQASLELDAEDRAEVLRQRVSGALRKELESLRVPQSGIRSRLIKPLPTTLCVMHIARKGKAVSCRVFWVGDSRAYVLAPGSGLQQLTVDDLRAPGDAWENLFNDSPMSNIANAEADFRMNSSELEIDEPSVFLVATDGCFGYIETPPLFEGLLLDTLMDARDENHWQALLEKVISAITRDDATLALLWVGWDTFTEMKMSFAARYSVLQKQFMDACGDQEPPEKPFKLDPDAALRWWKLYKREYESRMARREEVGHA